MNTDISFIAAFISVFVEMAPYLGFGLLIAGALHVFIKKSFTTNTNNGG